MSKVTWILDKPITLMNGDTLDIPTDDERYGETKPLWINRADGSREEWILRRSPDNGEAGRE